MKKNKDSKDHAEIRAQTKWNKKHPFYIAD